MSKKLTKTPTAFRIDPELIDRMKDVKERDGVPLGEQMRRAIREWLDRREAGSSGKRKATR